MSRPGGPAYAAATAVSTTLPAPARPAMAGIARCVARVVGYLLRRGITFYRRKTGLAANAVRAIEPVTADGELCRVDGGTDPELFRALSETAPTVMGGALHLAGREAGRRARHPHGLAEPYLGDHLLLDELGDPGPAELLRVPGAGFRVTAGGRRAAAARWGRRRFGRPALGRSAPATPTPAPACRDFRRRHGQGPDAITRVPFRAVPSPAPGRERRPRP